MKIFDVYLNPYFIRVSAKALIRRDKNTALQVFNVVAIYSIC